jgi:hypothetical protein
MGKPGTEVPQAVGEQASPVGTQVTIRQYAKRLQLGTVAEQFVPMAESSHQRKAGPSQLSGSVAGEGSRRARTQYRGAAYQGGALSQSEDAGRVCVLRCAAHSGLQKYKRLATASRAPTVCSGSPHLTSGQDLLAWPLPSFAEYVHAGHL